MKIDVLGVEFDNVTVDQAAEIAFEKMAERKGAYVVTPNPEIVWLCRSDKKLHDAVSKADLVLADGIGIKYGASILKRPLQGRTPGIDFAQALFEKMAGAGKTLYLFGAKPGVADAAAENLLKKYPGLVIVGTHDGYFKDDSPVIGEINEKKPDLLLVCLGVPKQEMWMSANKDRLSVGVMAGLGGSLDVFAGVVERAPEKWQKLGLEWLYRLKKEPSRIGRMMKLPLFMFAVIGQRIKEIFKKG